MSSDDFDLSFGEWLRRRRGGLGLTQTDLADQLGCAPITLRKIEAEERRPSQPMAKRLATLLGVPVEQTADFVRFARGELRSGEKLSATNGTNGAIANGVTATPEQLAPRLSAPTPPYAIIGREETLTRAKHMLTSARTHVLSLIGPPGVGKTRLALELAHDLHASRQFAHGTTFIELAPVQDASLVATAIAEALHIEDSSAISTAHAVRTALRDKRMLLVLDNFEHVLAAAPFVADLVAACKGIVCLITSRERLRVRAEHVLTVPTLALPHGATLDLVQTAAASRLFIARAQQANSDFVVGRADAPPIAAVCARLDGLPLALELLAARADIFTPAQLHADLARGLDALEDGPRDLPERHRTLRNAIRWSVRLLTEAQQTLFAHLAVFAGSFDAAAAQAVCPHAHDDLQALLHGSLAQSFGTVGTARFRLLEPIRQYAEEVLVQHHARDNTRERHATYFADMAAAARDALLQANAAAWMTRLEADHANLQSAILWSLQSHQPEYALRIGQGIFRFWHRRGQWREPLAWLEQALAMDDASPQRAPIDIRLKAIRAAGIMAHSLSQYDRAEGHLQAGLAIAYRLEDDAQVASTYTNLGVLRKDQGRFDEALAFFDQSIPFQPANALKFPWQSKADVLLRLGRFDEAEVLYRKAMALNIEIGDEEGLRHTLQGLGEIAWRRGDADLAEKYLRETEALCRKLNHERGLSWTAQQFGNVARVRGAWRAASAHYAQALAQMNSMGDQWGACEVLAECAHLAVATRHYDLGARWLGMAQVGFRALGARLTHYEEGLIDASLKACAQHLDANALTQAAQSGAQDWHTADVARAVAALQSATYSVSH